MSRLLQFHRQASRQQLNMQAALEQQTADLAIEFAKDRLDKGSRTEDKLPIVLQRQSQKAIHQSTDRTIAVACPASSDILDIQKV